MAVSFTRSDLEFLLTQILSAESGQPPVNPHLAFGLREVAGTNNSAVPGQSTYGSSDQPFPTVTTQYFQTVTVNVDGTIFDPNPGVDGDVMTTTYASTSPGGMIVDPAPRIISNLISDISANNPAALQRRNSQLSLATATPGSSRRRVITASTVPMPMARISSSATSRRMPACRRRSTRG